MNIKKIFSFKFKIRVKLFLQRFKQFDYFQNLVIDKQRQQAYIFLAADYGNLGDVAITYAQKQFIESKSTYQVIEIPISKSIEGIEFVRRVIKKDDIITIVGGGNMGDLYKQIEFIRQLVVTTFIDNRIITFPQTIDFLDERELLKAKKVYNSHPNIVILAREKTSFSLMSQYFENASLRITPDIVLSLNQRSPELTRSGAVFCLRSDKEKNLTSEQNSFIIETVTRQFGKVEHYDTHIGRDHLSVKERIVELNNIWDKFRGAELVVTDRLHGMIFCYITGTPCLVFQNNNHKVRETFEWISNCGGIKLLKTFDEVEITNFFANPLAEVRPISNLDEQYKVLISALTSV